MDIGRIDTAFGCVRVWREHRISTRRICSGIRQELLPDILRWIPHAATAPMPVAIHGVVGTIIDLGTSTISVKDQQNNEQSVAVSSTTDIRDGDGDVRVTSLAVGDMIAVIGGPNDMGQIDARFIRVLTASSSTPMQ